MKQLNSGLKKLWGLIGGLAIGVMLTAGTLALPASPAYAAAPTPQAERGLYLEYLLQRQQLWLTGQQNHLDQAREFVAITQPFIDELKAKGKDTSALETALANLNSQIQAAQVSHDTAKQILETKAGFDANGKVTDPEQARETLQSARQSMLEAHQTLKQAIQDFRQVAREFRQANKPDKQG